MSASTENKQEDKQEDNERYGHELFIGLVGATGSDLASVESYIKDILSNFEYKMTGIKFSSFFESEESFIKKYLTQNDIKIDRTNAFNKIYSQMEAGNKIRSVTDLNSILSRCAIEKINRNRVKEIDQKTETRKPIISESSAYLFNSLKHPSESEFLQETYGASYYQISVFSSEKQRASYLQKKGIQTLSDAYKLIEKDISEDDDFGQQTRDTFHLSDFFIKHDYEDEDETRRQLERIFDLIFGHPHITPTIDEHMMYMAYAYSTRSADLSRQVGAVIANESGDISGLGSNDVPRYGGGPYWPCPKTNNNLDWRDYKRGEDANQINKNKMIVDVVKNIKKEFKEIIDDMNLHEDEKKNEDEKKKLLSHFEDSNPGDDSLLEIGKKYFKGTDFLDISEFGRATHAEMSAILNCSRNGVTPKGKILYCTTFPCHNCAKHIVDAGIKKVFFVEPYPKSKAQVLHGDAISFEDHKEGKVIFDHFIGVAARKYLDLFSLKLGMGKSPSRKDEKTGKIKKFERKTSNIKVHGHVHKYLKDEEDAVASLKEIIEELGEKNE